MDPFLAALIDAGREQDPVAVLVRRSRPDTALPSWCRAVASFGDVSTCRVPRGRLAQLRDEPGVVSVKAPRSYGPEVAVLLPDAVVPGDERRPPSFTGRGHGAIVALIDWGVDFAHVDLRRSDGGSRLLALWDQRPGPAPEAPAPYGYGRVHTRGDIDRALATPAPYLTLGFDPADSDTGTGAHGTHTATIAAGNGQSGAPEALASDADVIFVHLSTWGTEGPDGLGDSIALVEALDFIDRTAGTRPCAINLSLGRCAGPHDGSTLVERCLDQLSRAPGRVIVQSTGNYLSRQGHASGRLQAHQRAELLLEVPRRLAPAHVELWLAPGDSADVAVTAPGSEPCSLAPSGPTEIRTNSREVVAVARRRGRDPNNGRSVVLLTIPPSAPVGQWRIDLAGQDVADGRWHAWVERGPERARVALRPSDPATTTGSICNGLGTITVGAIDGHRSDTPVAPFSSFGPTVDGRPKPDVLAPGVAVLAARSAPRGSAQPSAATTRMSGTSMAAPHITGLAAAALAARPRLSTPQVRAAVASTARRLAGDDTGPGVFDPSAALQELLDPDRSKTMFELIPSSSAQGLDDGGSAGLIAGGGDPVRTLRAGDRFVRSFPSEGIETTVVIADPQPLTRAGLEARGLSAPGSLDGHFVRAVDGTGSPIVVHLATPEGSLVRGGQLFRDSGLAQEGGADGVNRHSQAYVAWYQAALNQVAGENLAVDGIHGPLTDGAVRRFQGSKGLQVDGIVGPITERALVNAGAVTPPGASPDVPPPDVPPVIPPFPNIPPVIPPIVTVDPPCPVIIVPGIMGTRLVDPATGAGVWDPTGRLTDFSVDFPRLANRAPLDPNETGTNLPGRRPLPPDLAGVPHFNNLIYEFYGKLVETLVRPPFVGSAAAVGGRPVYAAGYDFRKSVRVTSGRLKAVVEQALADHPDARDVIIVAHSLGGLVSRAFLRGNVRTAFGGTVPATSVVRHLVLLASPSQGAPKAYRQLKTGLDLSLDGNLAKIFRLRAPLMSSRDMIRTFDSAYELLPTRRFCAANPGWLDFDRAAARLPDASSADLTYVNSHLGFLETPSAPISASLVGRTITDSLLDCFFPVPTTAMFSSHLPTEIGYDVRSGFFGFTVTPRNGAGDGTVPVASATASGCSGSGLVRLRKTSEHGEFANNPAVIDEIQRILLTAPRVITASAQAPSRDLVLV